MIPGSDEWIKALADTASKNAEAKLIEIAVQAARHHNASALTLSQPDTALVSLILHEVQDESFSLGVRTGVDMMITLMQQTEGTRQ